MNTLSLGQAAKLAGVGKTTVSRAISSGRLSAQRNDDGGYAIDPAELGRVYDLDASRLEKGTTTSNDDGDGNGRVERHETVEVLLAKDSEISILKAQIEGLMQLMAGETARREAAEIDRDRWAKQAERVAGLLPQPSQATPPETAARSGFFSALFGRRAA